MSHAQVREATARGPASIYELLQRAAERGPERTALTFLPDLRSEPRRLSYRQFLARLHQTANAFHRLGVGSGEVVALLAPSVPEAFIALFAAEAMGIANPINFLLRPDDIAAMLRAAGAKLLVAFGPHPALDIWPKAKALRDQVPSLSAVLTLGPPDDTGGAPRLEVLSSVEPDDRLLGDRAIGADDVAAYFHTGGSTGSPKLAIHSHGNQVFTATALARAWGFGPDTRIVNGLPLFHVAGSLLLGLGPLAAGAEILVPTAAGLRNPDVVAAHWLLVERYRPTIVGGIPTSLVALLGTSPAGADIGSARFCATGGAQLPAQLAEEFQQRFGLPVHEIYGMTECAGLIATAPLDRPPHYGAVGYAVPGVDIEARRFLADGGVGEKLRAGESGVLVVRGPNVFRGYLDARHNARAFTPDGGLVTGDLGSVDASGHVRVTGRAKDVIIRGGHNIDPVAIEEAAARHPAVAMSAAVGQPDAYAGEVPILYVTLRPDASCDISALEQHLREAVPEPPARPREVVVLDAMPLTAVGKIAKPVLRLDAARRAALAAVAPLVAAADACVAAREDAAGLYVEVSVRNAPMSERDGLRHRLKAALGRFGFRHEVVFA